jgi:hypothetical protein
MARGHHPSPPSLYARNQATMAWFQPFSPKPPCLVCKRATPPLLPPTHLHLPHLPATSPHHCELPFDMARPKPSPRSSVFVFCAPNPTPTYIKELVPQPTPPASKTHTLSLQHCPPYLNMTSAACHSPKLSPTAWFWMLITPPAMCAQSATTTLSTPHPTPSMRSPIPKYEARHPIVREN